MIWNKNSKHTKPDLHIGVLVCHVLGAGGENYDVASYAGRDEGGAHRWILSGSICIADNCITHWATITGPNESTNMEGTHVIA